MHGKLVKQLVLVLALLCSQAWGAITPHATSTGPNTNGGTETITLPTVSNNDYVLCGFVSTNETTPGTTTLAPYTFTAGWTALVNVAGSLVVGKVWTTGAGTTVSATQQNGAGSFLASACVSYTPGTAAAVDGAANWTVSSFKDAHGGSPATLCRGPSSSPAFTNDLEVAVLMSDNSGGGAFGTPSGLTSRVTSAPGPAIAFYDKALSTGAATGNADGTCTGMSPYGFGVQILLHDTGTGSPATTAVQPTTGGTGIALCANGFSYLYPSNGDLVLAITQGAGAGTTISGFTKVFQTADVGLFTQTWSSGSSVSVTLSGSNMNPGCVLVLVRNYNPSGGVLISPTVDASATTTGSVITSLASASIAANSASDLLLVFWSAGDNTVANSNAWTLDAGLEKDWVFTLNSSTETYGEGILQAPSNPTGTFTSSISAAARAGAGAVTFIIAAASSHGTYFPQMR